MAFLNTLEPLKEEIGGINAQIQDSGWDSLGAWDSWRSNFREYYDNDLITTDTDVSEWRGALENWKSRMRSDGVYAPPWVNEPADEPTKEDPPPPPPPPREVDPPPFDGEESAAFDWSTLLPLALIGVGAFLLYRAQDEASKE